MMVIYRELRIRELEPSSEGEIALVALRMRQTLMEVEGDEVGRGMYSMAWLKERVRWHLDAQCCTGKVLLALDDPRNIIGHTIVRREVESDQTAYGLFSTIYVEPRWRGRSVADQLIEAGEGWFRALELSRAATWTSGTNHKLIRVFARHGYREVDAARHQGTGTWMVKLARQWGLDPIPSVCEIER